MAGILVLMYSCHVSEVKFRRNLIDEHSPTAVGVGPPVGWSANFYGTLRKSGHEKLSRKNLFPKI